MSKDLSFKKKLRVNQDYSGLPSDLVSGPQLDFGVFLHQKVDCS